MTSEKKPSLLSGELPPKPPQVDIKQETTTVEGKTEQHRKLEEIGVRLKPDRADLKWAGSFAVHIYGEDVGMGFAVVAQTAFGPEAIPNLVAAKALQELSIAVARRYGWEPGSKKERANRRDN